jgi:hypothetical protein
MNGETFAIGKRRKGRGPATKKQMRARQRSEAAQAKADLPAEDERKPRGRE